MLTRPPKDTFTPAEYLAMEEIAEARSEYLDGGIFLMVTGPIDHSVVVMNVATELHRILEPTPYHVFVSDMRLFVQQSGLFTYPDVMILGAKIEYVPKRKDTITNPIVVVEVLSESTREYDRGEKFKFYKQIPSLQEYILVESEQPRVERYRRAPGDTWTIQTYDGLDAVARIESVECEIPLRRIYNKVSWL